MLNKSNGNMYEWITKKENPLCGECSHNCSYCYVKRIKKRYPKLMEKYSGELRIDEKVLNKKFKKDDFVFVCTCNDLFADNVPENFIKRIIDYYSQFESKFLYQTKNPKRILNFKLPKSVICTTIESDMFYSKIMANSTKPYDRAKYIKMISDCGFETFVTIEPILDFNLNLMVNLLKQCSPEQINIGADSGNNNLPEPPKEKIFELISELEKFTVVHQKSNLKRLLK